MRQVELAPHPVDAGIRRQQHVVYIAAQLRQPGAAFHDTVEFIAVQDQHAPAVGALVDIFAMNFEVAEHGPVEFAEYLVMVAGNENHFGAPLGLAQDSTQYVVVGLRPEHALLHAPHIDDVADQE